MCSFVVPDAKQFGIKKIQVDEQIGITPRFRKYNLVNGLFSRLPWGYRRVGVPCLWTHCAIRTSADLGAHKRRAGNRGYVQDTCKTLS